MITAIAMAPAMYSRIESGKTEPSVSTLEKIAKALGVGLHDFFNPQQSILADVNAYDASLVEKLQLIDSLSEEEKKTVFSIVDAFAGKKKLREALNNVVSLAS